MDPGVGAGAGAELGNIQYLWKGGNYNQDKYYLDTVCMDKCPIITHNLSRMVPQIHPSQSGLDITSMVFLPSGRED